MTAESINDSGQVVGSGPSGGYLWQPDAPNMTTGAFFPIDPPSGFTSAFPSAINHSGMVVGSTATGIPNNGHAFLWTPDMPNGTTGSSVDLGTLDGLTQSQAHDVNESGTIVGSSGNGVRGFVWTSDDLMLDLNDLLDASGAGWTLQSANAINDAGMIVGLGLFDPDGPGGLAVVQRPFLLTPVPEPTSAAAGLAAALLPCASFTRRRAPAARRIRERPSPRRTASRAALSRACPYRSA
jgi:probable HAF family extracellular repeat protein